jgi:hypothetical protein
MKENNYKLKIIIDVDGQKKVFDYDYDSKKEMESDIKYYRKQYKKQNLEAFFNTQKITTTYGKVKVVI